MSDMELFDIRVTVEQIEGRSVCSLSVGDYFEVKNSGQVSIPEGKQFCMWAMQSVMPLIPAKMRQLPASDWLETDTHVACPDPDERVIMRIDRLGTTRLNSSDLT